MIAMRTRTVIAVLPKSNILYQYFLIFEQKIFARTYYKAPREGVERHIFWPRQGLRTVKDLEKEKKDIDENVEENPLDIDWTGKTKVTGKHLYHYSDRTAGKGYTNYADTIYTDRENMDPIARQTMKYIIWAMVPLIAVLFIDVEWSIVQIRAIYQDLKDDYFDDRP